MRRRLKLRPRMYPENDVFFLDAESLRKIMSYSQHYFYKWVLPNSEAYGIPRLVILGPIADRPHTIDGRWRSKDLEHCRWRADELYALRPDLSPYPPHSCWVTRFKARAAVDRDAYIAQREAERSVRAGAA